jgi:glycosyltransferase involved in cell wall biosynthesis
MDYPSAKLVLANAGGDYNLFIQSELEQLPKENYVEITFENDIASLYHLFDIFIHVPISKNIEAFGQIYIESMAAGIPGIFTLSGTGNDVCKHEENCLVVDYMNHQQIYNSMLRLLSDDVLRNSLAEKAQKTSENYGLKPFIERLEKLYIT